MKQTRLGSFIESVVNVLIGYWVAVGTQALVFPWFGLHASFRQNMGIGLIFTVISIARSYLLRRYFNARLHRLLTETL